MTLLGCRRLLVRARASLAGGLAVLLVGLVVIVAHSGPMAHEMADHSTMSDAVSVCLGVIQVGGGLMVATLLGLIRRRAPRFVDLRPAAPLEFVASAGPVPGSRIREGPSAQQVFRN
ncbi:MAG: hypothetical protein J0H98_03115 [Solirubrobacterales bacterium]|nr:hypothetical protein [Solirubrobacterales bacterium]